MQTTTHVRFAQNNQSPMHNSLQALVNSYHSSKTINLLNPLFYNSIQAFSQETLLSVFWQLRHLSPGTEPVVATNYLQNLIKAACLLSLKYLLHCIIKVKVRLTYFLPLTVLQGLGPCIQQLIISAVLNCACNHLCSHFCIRSGHSLDFNCFFHCIGMHPLAANIFYNSTLCTEISCGKFQDIFWFDGFLQVHQTFYSILR